MILCLVGSRARCRLLVLTALLAALAVFPAAAENPDNPAKAEEFFFQGSHLLSRNQTQAGLDLLEKAVQLAPDNVKYRGVLAIAHNNLGLDMRRKGEMTGALRHLARAVELAPEDAEVKSNFVKAVFNSLALPPAQFSTADRITYLKQAVALDPTKVEGKKALAALLNNLAVNEGKRGKHDEEVARLEEAASLDQGNPKIQIGRASCRERV